MRISICILSGLLLCCAAARAGELRVGKAAVVITPAIGTPMAGYYSARAAEAVADDLYAKAIVIEHDGTKAALVACDLIAMPQPVVEQARSIIERTTGLRGDHVMISATHTHTGPVLVGRSAREPAEGAPASAAEFVTSLPHLIAKSVKLAEQDLLPAKMSAGVGREENLAFNRRFFMKDGAVGWNPGKLNPNIDRPAGPTDPQVPVVYFESADGAPLATYINFAMHLDTVGGQRISADYPHTLSTLLGRLKGPQMLTLFTIGTAGDINHVNVSSPEPQKGPQEAERIGTILAGEVLKTYARLRPVESSELRARTRVISLPLAEIRPGELEQARQTAVKFGPNAPTFLERVHAFKVLDVAARQGKPLEAEVQVIALGDEIAWVGLPGEVFVELGLAIKEASGFRHTIIAELANGSIGYIPTRRAYAEGNYEPVSARCAAGSGEMLVETAVKLLNELHPATAR